MQESKTQTETPKNKGGRPPKEISLAKATERSIVIEEDGDSVLIRIPKKNLAKLLLKDLI